METDSGRIHSSRWSYARKLVTVHCSGGGLFKLVLHFDTIGEFYTFDEFWQFILAIQTLPSFLRRHHQFENHAERSISGQAALGLDRPVAH